jgi:hypothetical protein
VPKTVFLYALLIASIAAGTLYAVRALVPYVSGDYLIVTPRAEPAPVTPSYTIPQEANP